MLKGAGKDKCPDYHKTGNPDVSTDSVGIKEMNGNPIFTKWPKCIIRCRRGQFQARFKNPKQIVCTSNDRQ